MIKHNSDILMLYHILYISEKECSIKKGIKKFILLYNQGRHLKKYLYSFAKDIFKLHPTTTEIKIFFVDFSITFEKENSNIYISIYDGLDFTNIYSLNMHKIIINEKLQRISLYINIHYKSLLKLLETAKTINTNINSDLSNKKIFYLDNISKDEPAISASYEI